MTKMTNVLHLVSSGVFSGAEKVARDIAVNFNKSRYNFTYVCTGENLAGVVRKHNITTYVVPPFYNHRAFFPCKYIQDIIKKEKIGLLHAHDLNASIKLLILAKKNGIPVISHIHNTYDWLKQFSFKRAVDMTFRNQYAFSIAVSEHTLNYYLKHNFLANPDRIFCLPNAINLDEVPDKFHRVLPEPYIKCISIGRLTNNQKRIDIMLKAFREVAIEMQKARLYIVGDGGDRTRLEELRDFMGLGEVVFFLGRKPNVYDYLNDADIFLMSSDLEGLPMVLLEALAMKKVIIATDVGGVSEVVRDGETGFLVNREDYRALAEKTLNAIRNLDEYKNTIGINAYEFVAKEYNIKSYIARIEDIYDTVLVRNSV